MNGFPRYWIPGGQRLILSGIKKILLNQYKIDTETNGINAEEYRLVLNFTATVDPDTDLVLIFCKSLATWSLRAFMNEIFSPQGWDWPTGL